MPSREVIQFDELEAELDEILMEMARQFSEVDPAKVVGEITVEQAEKFAAPFFVQFRDRLVNLEMEFNAEFVKEEFEAVISEFDTVDRAVYAKTDEQEPTQGLSILVSEHKTRIMTHLQHQDEGYNG